MKIEFLNKIKFFDLGNCIGNFHQKMMIKNEMIAKNEIKFNQNSNRKNKNTAIFGKKKKIFQLNKFPNKFKHHLIQITFYHCMPFQTPSKTNSIKTLFQKAIRVVVLSKGSAELSHRGK